MICWTEDLVNKLKAWIAGGLTPAAIAKLVPGATKNAICGKLGRLQISSANGRAGRPPMIRDQNFIGKVLRRRQAGASLMAIAIELDCNVKTISNVVANLRQTERLRNDFTKPLIIRTKKPAGFVPPPLAATDIQPETSDCSVTFFDLKPHHCRWPVSGEKMGISYCGREKIKNEAYCYTHMHRASARYANSG